MSSGNKELNGLNEQQKEAVLHTEGPLLIVAGAGAGKTKTLTHRILHLMHKDVPGNRILAITFTNKAAREMGERVHHLFTESGLGGASPFVSTFHSLGVHILKRHGAVLGLPRHFTILDKSDSLSVLKAALKEKNLDPKQFEPKRFRELISREKGECMTPETYAEKAGNAYFPKIASEVWLAYERILRKQNALDFDDLLLKTLLLLRNHNDVREYYQDLWQYIHVDEYQDTNSVQYEITKMLANKHKNICVVGDADQNIYSWRGANIKNILSFERDYPGAKIVLLEENYRSTKIILDTANAIIQKNKVRVPKNLFTRRDGGEKISIFEAYDETDEAGFVARKIADLLAEKKPANEIAVLFRANYQSRAIEEAFLAAGIPYQMLGVRFFERKEIKDVLSYLKAALNPESLPDIERSLNTPPRGIGAVTLQKIFSGGRESLPKAMGEKVNSFYTLLAQIREKILSEKTSVAVQYAIEASGVGKMYRKGNEEDEERIENIRELGALATKYDAFPPGEGIEKLLEEASLMSDQDALGEEEDGGGAVKLMTVHASKGLEFSYVFITGLEDGLFPHKSFDASEISREREEEERRLFYVALTRAKEKLFLSHAAVRTVFGGRQMNLPSEFLLDIPAENTEREREAIKTIYL